MKRRGRPSKLRKALKAVLDEPCQAVVEEEVSLAVLEGQKVVHITVLARNMTGKAIQAIEVVDRLTRMLFFVRAYGTGYSE